MHWIEPSILYGSGNLQLCQRYLGYHFLPISGEKKYNSVRPIWVIIFFFANIWGKKKQIASNALENPQKLMIIYPCTVNEVQIQIQWSLEFNSVDSGIPMQWSLKFQSMDWGCENSPE